LKDFVLKVIQHQDGQVRQAIVKVADWLYVSLTSRANPFVWPKGKELTPEQKIEQEKAKKQYIDYINEVEGLLRKYDDGNEDSSEYINGMKPSIFKSLQYLRSDLTRSPYLAQLMSNPPAEILAKRKEIEQELIGFLKETKSDFDLRDIRYIIYNENGTDDLKEIIKMFDTGYGIVELENILEAVNDAWNYFPHKILDDFSPVEKLLEYQ